VHDLKIAVNLAERHVSRQLRLAYLALKMLKRLIYKREVTAVTIIELMECAVLPWAEQTGVLFGAKHRLFLYSPLVGNGPRYFTLNRFTCKF
jgi:hypothetical protein